MTFLARLFGPPRERLALRPLYDALVERAREPAWYTDGGVPDTIDGRFEMVTAVLALVLLRLERDPAAAGEATLLTELFIDDMEGTIRELGIGDVVVGKRVGKLVGALGARLGSFRQGVDSPAFEQAIAHNVFRDAPPSPEALAFVVARLRALDSALAGARFADLLAGTLP